MRALKQSFLRVLQLFCVSFKEKCTREAILAEDAIAQCIAHKLSCPWVRLVLPAAISELVDEECTLSILHTEAKFYAPLF